MITLPDVLITGFGDLIPRPSSVFSPVSLIPVLDFEIAEGVGHELPTGIDRRCS